MCVHEREREREREGREERVRERERERDKIIVRCVKFVECLPSCNCQIKILIHVSKFLTNIISACLLFSFQMVSAE